MVPIEPRDYMDATIYYQSWHTSFPAVATAATLSDVPTNISMH